MKMSAFYKGKGRNVILAKNVAYIKAHHYLASAVFRIPNTAEKLAELRNIYGNDVDIGGSGVNLSRKLPSEIEVCFPDYSLYSHTSYALGFLTRGCPKKCVFCVVPQKEGRLKSQVAKLSGFVPPDWKNVMLLYPAFPVYRKFYGGFIRKTRSESPMHAKILATKDFVPKPEGKSFKTAWIHKSTFFKEIPLVRPNVPSNQEKALCGPGTKYPTQIPKPRECRKKEEKKERPHRPSPKIFKKTFV